MSDQIIDSDLRPEIERRAYQRYLERGGVGGSDLDDWLSAEDEIRREKSANAE